MSYPHASSIDRSRPGRRIPIIGLAVAMLGLVGAGAEPIVTTSPDGVLEFAVDPGNDPLTYSIRVAGKTMVRPTPIAITIDGIACPGGTAVTDTRRRTIDREIVPTISTVTSVVREHCQETVITFESPVALRIRAFDDGAAFRWESRIEKEAVVVNHEAFALNFADDVPMYFPIPNGEGFFSHQECQFNYQTVSATVNEPKPGTTPALFELGDDRYLLLTDVDVESYPGLWIQGAGDTTIQGRFPAYPVETELRNDRDFPVTVYADVLARTTGTRTYPWRAFVIADAEGLLESTLLYSLAEPCRLDDTSWIRPGKVSWDWWNAWNITDVDFEAGINQATYQDYIDFASANGLPYIILDEGWSVRGPDTLLDVIPALDIPKLVEYGAARNVGLILWMTAVTLERSFDQAFDQFSAWGIRGLKVDFMQRDDQVMMEFCQRVAATAAQRKLLVDFHGGSKPTGLQRTYPNVLAHESVLGLEQSKWSKNANPDMAVLLPFIRMVAGPMDYTPGAMDNFTDATFRQDFNNPASLGTRCHQLAMYVVFLSPLQMLADTPTKYRRNPACMEFLRAVPTTWEETVVLAAEVGDVIAVARRSGDDWYLGALTDWHPRELSVSLDFLSERDYDLAAWTDGPDASKTPTEFVVERTRVSPGSTISITLAPGGGYAAMLKPAMP